MLYQNILETIGNTPIVKINKINPNPKVNIYIKLEGQNPGGSVKDRIAISMVAAAENDGSLTKDKIIIEPTSGNTGIGLAMVAAYKGYSIVLVMSEGMSEERRKILKALGAEFVLTDKTKGTDGAIMKDQEMYEKNPEKYWLPNQFANPANPEAHYQTTAVEILKVPMPSPPVPQVSRSGWPLASFSGSTPACRNPSLARARITSAKPNSKKIAGKAANIP